ncbi:MAG: SH3 domain-containing protein, partial [Clostridia bacterium]|nr:SH3 domain-containing protein [Clostridia bacterium]
MKIYRCIALILCSLMLALPIGSMAQSVQIAGDIAVVTRESTTVKYASKAAKVFKNKKTSSKVVARVKKGDVVEVVSTGNTWSQVIYDGVSGFMKTKVLQNN